MAKTKFVSRHELPDGSVEWVEHEGTKVSIPEYERWTFIFHRRENLKGWFISELSSGLCVYPVTEYCKNKAQAVDVARQYMDKYTLEKKDMLEVGIKLFLKTHNNGEPINIPPTRAKQRRLL